MGFKDGILREHNIQPYVKLMQDIERYGKGCAIHATGTGKMYLALKWLNDNKNEPFMYLAPTKTILNKFADIVLQTYFEAGYENLKNATIEEKLEVIRILMNNKDIHFLTYTKLHYMSDEEQRELQVKNVVLDEFHHLGADKWGDATERLFESHKGAKIMGLSATPIRPSDGQNMVELLFDGRISSIINLEDAIGNVLPYPRMIYGVYSFKEALDEIEEKLDKKVLSEEDRKSVAEKIKEARKIIEKADGIQEIFKETLAEYNLRSGKFIVFCSSIEDMKNKMAVCRSWFPEDVDLKISSVSSDEDYCENVRTIESFEKSDFDGIHLLFSVNMLNEGLHVEDLSGVIMLRPTDSNIIFLQQLGRALAVSDVRRKPLVFDLVNNVEIMRKDMELFRNSISKGRLIEGKEAEKEKIYFELHTKMIEIMDYLESVHRNYNSRRIREEIFLAYCSDPSHPTLEKIKLNEKFEYQGRMVNIGNMVEIVRAQYKLRGADAEEVRNAKYRVLDDEEVEFFEKLKLKWVSDYSTDFDKKIEIFKQWCEKNNKQMKDIKTGDVFDGYLVGRWAHQFRVKYRKKTLTPYEKEKLDEIGFSYETDRFSSFEEKIEILKEYCQKNNKTLQDIGSEDVYEGYRIGSWIDSFVKKYKFREADEETRKKYGLPLTVDEIRLLEDLGMIWDRSRVTPFEKKMEILRQYVSENGDLSKVKRHDTYLSYPIGDWISLFRISKGYGKLKIDEENQLNELGMSWNASQAVPLAEKIRIFKEWKEENQKEFCQIEYDEEYKGYPIGVWRHIFRAKYKRRLDGVTGEKGEKGARILTDEELNALNLLEGFWEAKAHFELSKKVQILEEYCEKYNKSLANIGVNERYGDYSIRNWVLHLRKYYRENKLDQDLIDRLEKIGMVWEKVFSFDRKIEIIRKYCEETGKNVNDISESEMYGEYEVGEWVKIYRFRLRLKEDLDNGIERTLNAKPLTDKEVEVLNKLGLISRRTISEKEKLEILMSYFEEKGTLANIKQSEEYRGYTIGFWISIFRKKYSNGTLNEKTKELLDKMKMNWAVRKK